MVTIEEVFVQRVVTVKVVSALRERERGPAVKGHVQVKLHY